MSPNILLDVRKQGRVLHRQQLVHRFDGVLDHRQLGSVVVVTVDDRLMRFLEVVCSEEEVDQLDLLVFGVLQNAEFPSSLERQP